MGPPPLPPRNPPPPYQEKSPLAPDTSSRPGPSPLYSGFGTGPNSGPVNGWLSADPRTSSSESLLPSAPDSTSGPRRTLLVVYIHGFYGNDQSFRSFPAHVHAFLRGLLDDSHVIHSKIYPRYKTYKAIEVARDNFSAWLEPHESPTTDVILVGHSMGGLLAADVVLMPNQDPYREQRFKHRILGTISLDSPFLGLHPGIIVSGLASLVQPAPKPPQESEQPSSSSTTPLSPISSLDRTTSIDSQSFSSGPGTPMSLSSAPSRQNTDPHFDPPFFNDAPFREQPFIKRMMNFASKHKSEGILKALRSHILSHLEFGGCLADYSGLLSRYRQVRALEDVDEIQAAADGHPSGSHTRVRFVNYYTLSPGRPKPPKRSDSESVAPSQTDVSSIARGASIDIESQSINSSAFSRSDLDPKEEVHPESDVATPSILTPSISMRDSEKVEHGQRNRGTESPPDMEPLSMQDLDPVPMSEEDEPPPTATQEESMSSTQPSTEPLTPSESQAPSETVALSEAASADQLSLPPIPDAPVEPTLPDLTLYTDKDARKQAEKESKRLQKAYDQAVKDRAKALREREKLLEKRRKKSQKEADQAKKNAQKEKQRLEREENKETQRIVQEQIDVAKPESDDEETDATVAKADKPKKQRKFCTLPGKINGEKDKTWVDIYMDGMDEVSAHCGLFFPGPHYEPLVGDVGNRILAWVQEDLSMRTIMELD